MLLNFLTHKHMLVLVSLKSNVNGCYCTYSSEGRWEKGWGRKGGSSQKQEKGKDFLHFWGFEEVCVSPQSNTRSLRSPVRWIDDIKKERGSHHTRLSLVPQEQRKHCKWVPLFVSHQYWPSFFFVCSVSSLAVPSGCSVLGLRYLEADDGRDWRHSEWFW